MKAIATDFVTRSPSPGRSPHSALSRSPVVHGRSVSLNSPLAYLGASHPNAYLNSLPLDFVTKPARSHSLPTHKLLTSPDRNATPTPRIKYHETSRLDSQEWYHESPTWRLSRFRSLDGTFNEFGVGNTDYELGGTQPLKIQKRKAVPSLL